jgi:serine/threonine protein kinase/WD40 repeat protein
MNTSCSLKILESALSGELPAQDEIALERHLESCDQCSAELERLAGGPDLCQEAASLLAEDELDSAMPIGDGWSEIDFVVEHLDPADEPNLLGRLGGYDVLEIIGRGGMGVVLKGFDRQLKRCVAIKVLSPHLAQSSLARQRFAREAQAAAAVVHPNVLAIHQVQPGGRLPFLVMPLVAGESLAERLAAQGTLELKEILRIGMQAGAGLAAAHEQGLVHRDVKPANILLEKGVERAVLTDFGLARAADDVTLTRQGIIAGTPQYMSPEQARGEPLDSRSDLFSLGSVLYEMATGVSPFRADSTMATLRRLVEESPRAIGSIKPELPPWLIAIIDRLLQKDPARRFGSAKEVSQLLEGCLAHVQQPASVPLPAGLPKPALRSRLRSTKRVIKGVLAMISAVAIGLWGFCLLPTGVPDISGQWSGEDWGQVELKNTSSTEYSGTYSETTGKQPGELELKWSHVERRFNGTWREGDDRFGQISLRLVDQEIRGAYTTDAKSKINPGTPALADLQWEKRHADDTPLADRGRPVPQTYVPIVITPPVPQSPAKGGVSGTEEELVAAEATVQEFDFASLGDFRMDLTLFKPRYALFGIVQFVSQSTGNTSELPDLNFYFVSPDNVSNSQVRVSWTLSERDPIEEDLFLEFNVTSGGRPLVDKSYRFAGKKPGETILGPIASEAAVRCRAYAGEPPIRIQLGQTSLEKPVWQALKVYDVVDVHNAVIGTIQLKLRACPILPDVALEGSEPIFENTNWREQDVFRQLIGPPAAQAATPPLPSDGLGLRPDKEIVVAATVSESVGIVGCAVDLTLARPRYGVFGRVQVDNKLDPSAAAIELPDLSFYLVSPDDSSKPAQANVSWNYYERDPSDGESFMQVKGIAGGREAFDNSFRLFGRKPGKALLERIGSERVTRCLAVAQPREMLIRFGQASAETPVWQTLNLLSAVNVNNVVLGTIQLKLRACPILPGVPLEGSAPIFKNTNWREHDEFKKLIGPADRPGMALTVRVPAMGEHPQLIDPAQAAAEPPRPPQTGRFMFGVGRVPQTTIQSAEPVSVVAYAPDGKTLALAVGPSTVGLYDAPSGKLIVELKLADEAEEAFLAATPMLTMHGPNRISALTFSADSTLLAVGNSIGQVKLFDAHTGEFERVIGEPISAANFQAPAEVVAKVRFAQGNVSAIAFSPDGRLLATCGPPQPNRGAIQPAESMAPLKLWDVKTGKRRPGSPGEHNAFVSTVAFSPDGKLLAGARHWNSDRTGAAVELWDPSTGKLAKLLPIADGTGCPTSLSFSPDGKQLAIGLLQHDPTEPYAGPDLRKGSLPLANDAAAKIGAIQVVDPVSGRVQSAWVGQGAVRQLAYSADGNTIAALRSGKGVTLFQSTSGFSNSRDIEPPEPQLGGEWNCFALAPAGSRLAIGGSDPNQHGFVSIRDLLAAAEAGGDQPADEAAALPKPAPVMQIPTDFPVNVIAYSPDGKWMAIGCKGGGIARLFDAQSGEPKAVVTLLDDEELKGEGLSPEQRTDIAVTAMAFSPDSRLLASGTIMGQVKLFDVSSGKRVITLERVKEKTPQNSQLGQANGLRLDFTRVVAIAFSPDSRLLATCGDPNWSAGPTPARGILKLWDVKTGELKYDLKDQSGGQVVAIAFSPDGKLLASAGEWTSSDLVATEGQTDLPTDKRIEEPVPNGGGQPGGEFGGIIGGIAVHTGVEFWNPLTGKRVQTLQLPSEAGLFGSLPSAFALAYSPRGNRFAVGVGQATFGGEVSQSIWLVNPEYGTIDRKLPAGFSNQLAFSPDGKFIAGFDSRRNWAMWDATSAKLASTILLQPRPKADGWDGFALAPSGKRVAIGQMANGKHGVQVWDLTSAR